MPQWFRDRSGDRERYPDERWQAACPLGLVPLLLRYDHHVVHIHGRPALLLTYSWGLEEPSTTSDSRTLEVSFTYPAGDPRAPRDVQSAVDQLSFSPVDVAETG